jgi:hypothetical protein
MCDFTDFYACLKLQNNFYNWLFQDVWVRVKSQAGVVDFSD